MTNQETENLTTIVATALTAIVEFTGVAVFNDGASTFDGVTSDASLVLKGIALNSAIIGEPVSIQVSASITNPSWNLSEGLIYIGASGALTQNPTGLSSLHPVAIATSPTTIRVNDGLTGYEATLDNLNRINVDSIEPTGMVDRTESSIAFDNATRTLTITPTGAGYSFWEAGIRYNKAAPESLAITNVEGIHHIYYEGGVLKEAAAFDLKLITTWVWVASIYWDATNGKRIHFGDERHGMVMDANTHAHFHLSIGATYITGLGLADFTIDGDGSLAAHAQLSNSGGVIRDEDIMHTLLGQIAPSNIPVMYRVGDGDWRRKEANTYPFIYSGEEGYAGGTVPYNEWTGITWQLTATPSNDYVLVHFYATNDIDHPVVAIQGQNSYTNQPQARDGANTEIGSITGLPYEEFVPIGTVIIHTNIAYTNVPKAAFVSTDTGDTYVNWLTNQLAAGSPIGDHGHLGGLSDDDHTQYLTDGRANTWLTTKSTSDLSEGTNLYYTATRANAAIDARVTKGFVDALGINATTLDNFDSTDVYLPRQSLSATQDYNAVTIPGTYRVNSLDTCTNSPYQELGPNIYRWGILVVGVIEASGAILQVYYGDNEGDVAYRVNWSGTWRSWKSISGSYSSADMVDGIHASQFLRSDIDDTLNGKLTIGGTVVAGNEGGELGFTRAPNSTMTTNPFIDSYIDTFRIVSYAGGTTRVHHLDCSEASGKLYHSGNFGKTEIDALGINAATLNNYTTGMGVYTANTVPVRDASGDIYARLFRSNYPEQTSAPATTADIAFRNSITDNYIRTMSNTAFSTWCQNALVKTYDSARLGGVVASSYIANSGNYDFDIASITNSSSYSAAAIELRELNHAGVQIGVRSEAPRLGFHWGGRVASQLCLELDGSIACIDNPGTGYEKFKASTLYENGVSLAAKYAPLGGGSGAPIGSIMLWPMAVPPTDYLECNGASLLRTTYASLFSILGTTYGAGSGEVGTTFNLPDYRGEFLRGWANGSTNDPDKLTRTSRGDGTTGDNVGTKQPTENKSHTHLIYTRAYGGSDNVVSRYASNTSANYQTSEASGGAESRPRNVNVMYCIKYQ